MIKLMNQLRRQMCITLANHKKGQKEEIIRIAPYGVETISKELFQANEDKIMGLVSQSFLVIKEEKAPVKEVKGGKK